MFDSLELLANRIDQMGETFFYYQHFCAAVIEDVVEVIGHQAKVKRHQDRTEQGRAEKGFEHAMAILRKHRDSIAFSTPNLRIELAQRLTRSPN